MSIDELYETVYSVNFIRPKYYQEAPISQWAHNEFTGTQYPSVSTDTYIAPPEPINTTPQTNPVVLTQDSFYGFAPNSNVFTGEIEEY